MNKQGFHGRVRAQPTPRPCPAGAHHMRYDGKADGGKFHGSCQNAGCGFSEDVALWAALVCGFPFLRDQDWNDRLYRALWARCLLQ